MLLAVVKLSRKGCRMASAMPCYPHAMLILERDGKEQRLHGVWGGGADVIICCLARACIGSGTRVLCN
jgi:hypothetical protein